MPKMFSITTEPVMMPVVRGPRMVTTGISALRSAWRRTTTRALRPFAQAVRT